MARLDDLIEYRDAVELALGTGAAFVEMTIRGRTVKKEASTKILEYLNTQIDKENAHASMRRSGPARNRMEIHR
jgi:hypothetical protein